MTQNRLHINADSVHLKDCDWVSVDKQIEDSQVEKLAIWINKTYGLQVYKVVDDVLSMAYGDGFHVCDIFTKMTNSGDTLYYYRSQFNQRSKYNRYLTSDVRNSNTLTGLKTTIKNILPTEEFVIKEVTKIMIEVEDVIRNTVNATSYKSKYEVDEDLVHALLQKVIGGANYITREVDINMATTILAKWDMADKEELERRSKTESLLSSPLHAVGFNSDGTYMVGIVQQTQVAQRAYPYEILTPFKRVKDFEDYPEIQAIATMLKVRNEFDNKDISFIPSKNKYDEDLNALTMPTPNAYQGTSGGGMAWLLTPAN